MNLADISGIPRNGKQYNGTTKKYGITVNGVDYIVKFAKDEDMTVCCEYLASALIRKIGVCCHEVWIGVCNGELVNIMKDFTSGTDFELHSYKDTKQSSLDTDLDTKEYTYEDVLYLMDKHLKMTEASKKDAKEKFWDMFICDAILGNRDRHWGNWGYLKEKGKNAGYVFAPLYDNGSSLHPGVNRVIKQYVNEDTRKQFVYDRVYIFPASLFKIKKKDRAYRSNYAEMFGDLRMNKIFAQRVARIRDLYSYISIFDIMMELCGDIPFGTEYKRYYVEIVTMRFMCIVLRMDFEKAYREIEGGLAHLGETGKKIVKHALNSRVPCICEVRTANMIYGGVVIGTISEERNDAGEFDWVIKMDWDGWERAGYPPVAGVDLDLRLDEYIRAFIPAFVEQRTLPDDRDGIREELEALGLNWNDRFEFMCRTHGLCGPSNITVERA